MFMETFPLVENSDVFHSNYRAYFMKEGSGAVTSAGVIGLLTIEPDTVDRNRVYNLLGSSLYKCAMGKCSVAFRGCTR